MFEHPEKHLHFYHLFGLTIESVIPFLHIEETEGRPDCIIRYGKTPETLPQATVKGVRFQMKPGEFIQQVDNIARYYVAQGRTIVVEPAPGAADEEILLFLMGSAMGALLHQRNILPLHASSIAAGDGGIIFAGPAGIGKSTLAGGFHKRGYPLLSDDVCAIDVGQDGRPHIMPGFPYIKLWADTLKKLEHNTEGLSHVRLDQSFEKYFLPFNPREQAPTPVKAVFVLGSTNTERLEVVPCERGEKIEPILHNTYRPRFLKGLGDRKEHFNKCAAIAARALVFKVVRPKSGFLLTELMDLVEGYFPV